MPHARETTLTLLWSYLPWSQFWVLHNFDTLRHILIMFGRNEEEACTMQERQLLFSSWCSYLPRSWNLVQAISLRETLGRVAGQLSDRLKKFAGQKKKLPDRKKRGVSTFKNLVHCYWYKLHVEVCYIHCLYSICSRFLGCEEIKKREKKETHFKTSSWWYYKNPTFARRRL